MFFSKDPEELLVTKYVQYINYRRASLCLTSLFNTVFRKEEREEVMVGRNNLPCFVP